MAGHDGLVATAGPVRLLHDPPDRNGIDTTGTDRLIKRSLPHPPGPVASSQRSLVRLVDTSEAGFQDPGCVVDRTARLHCIMRAATVMITTHVPEQIARKAGAAARVVLLMMAVVFFAVLWDSDSPQVRETWMARRAEMRRRAAASVTLRPAVPALAASISETHRSRTVVPLQTVSSDVERESSTIDLHWTLPIGIAPGTYRVVDSTGRISRLTVPASAGSSTAPGPELYTVEQGSLKIYYIRISTPEVIASRQ